MADGERAGCTGCGHSASPGAGYGDMCVEVDKSRGKSWGPCTNEDENGKINPVSVDADGEASAAL